MTVVIDAVISITLLDDQDTSIVGFAVIIMDNHDCNNSL